MLLKFAKNKKTKPNFEQTLIEYTNIHTVPRSCTQISCDDGRCYFDSHLENRQTWVQHVSQTGRRNGKDGSVCTETHICV